MDKHATQEFAPRPNICEGKTISLTNWQIEEEEAHTTPEGNFPAQYHISHYVGGEEYEVYHSAWASLKEARATVAALNAEGQTFTHYYEVE